MACSIECRFLYIIRILLKTGICIYLTSVPLLWSDLHENEIDAEYIGAEWRRVSEEEQHAVLLKPIPKNPCFLSPKALPETRARAEDTAVVDPPPGMLRGLVVLVVATLVSNPIRVAAITTKNVNVG